MPLLPEITVNSLDQNDIQSLVNSLVEQLNVWAQQISDEAHAADIGEGALALKNNQLILTRPSGTQVIIVGQQSQSTAIDDEGNFKAITGDSIEADTITATNITAGTITGTEIDFDTITGDNIASLDITSKTITADTGTIGGWQLGATEFAGPVGAVIRSGQTDFSVGTGFWLGNVSGTPKFSIGQSSGNQMSWDGTNLRVTGAFTPTTVFNTFTYTTAALPIPPTTVGFLSPGASE